MILRRTFSLCPRCLSRVPAWYEEHNDIVALVTECPEHGRSSAEVWRGSPAFSTWSRPKTPAFPEKAQTRVHDGCPFDCGLCPDHRQTTCTALIEVTGRCNLNCPICFASSGEKPVPDLSLGHIRRILHGVAANAPGCNVQISGGEPTVRDDLPHIVALAKEIGIAFVQLNTNGIRLAREPGYAQALAASGLTSVFLQFDSTNDAAYTILRGKPLMDIKKACITACAQAGIGVVLTAVLKPGVNNDQIGPIVRFAMEHMPGVRGVHFQPISYFGRYPEVPKNCDRITLPEVMTALERQTNGMVTSAHLHPPGCEHSLCSFSGQFIKHGNTLTPLSATPHCCCRPTDAREGAMASRALVAKQWAFPASAKDSTDPFEQGLQEIQDNKLSISAMAFQDVWTMDLERVQGCCIHVAVPDGRLIPFCAWNVTDAEGTSLYRNTSR
ncbi:MAG: radical SAM (seleno)protein TrsS [Desulfoplanes sp.]